MTAKNQERFIAGAIASILRQSYCEFELLVVDDQSTDQTAAIVRSLMEVDPRVTLLCCATPGRVACLNYALSVARSDYIAIMDADDLAPPHRLSLQVDFLDRHPRVVAVGGAFCHIGQDELDPVTAGDGRPISPKPLSPRSRLNGLRPKPLPILHSTVVMRRATVVEAGLYRPALIHQEDTDLFLRLEELGEIRNLPDVVHFYRQHDANTGRRYPIGQSAAWALALMLARRRRRGLTDWAYGNDRGRVWLLLCVCASISALNALLLIVLETRRRRGKRGRLARQLGTVRDLPTSARQAAST
ncbi:glycosyltransferase involved in cell wall biosynthesis [Rhodoligotrophos appendicifer]